MMNQLRCRPTSIPRMRPSLIWAFMLNSRLRNLADKPNFDPARPLLLSTFRGNREIDSAHSMPPETSRYLTSIVASRLARAVRSMKFLEDGILMDETAQGRVKSPNYKEVHLSCMMRVKRSTLLTSPVCI